MTKKTKQINKPPSGRKDALKKANRRGVPTLERVAAARKLGLVPESSPYTQEQIARGDVLGGCVPPTHTDLMVAPEDVLERSESRAGEDAGIFLPHAPAPTPQSVSMAVSMSLTALGQLMVTALGTPESAPLLANVKGWAKEVAKAEKLLVDSLKPHVLANGTLWGDAGSKELVMGGVRLPLKAINPPPADGKVTVAHLDPKKVEALLRDQLVSEEEPLEKYMRGTVIYALEGLSESQESHLNELLADEQWGPMLRECAKETTYALMTPEPV